MPDGRGISIDDPNDWSHAERALEMGIGVRLQPDATTGHR
jgi:hypothetical protein